MYTYASVCKRMAVCLPFCLLCLAAARCHAQRVESAAHPASQDASLQQISKESEQVVQRFYEAFYKQQWKETAAMFHPESLALLQSIFVHIAETTPNLSERKEYLKRFGGVATISALKKIDSKKFFVLVFSGMWPLLSDEAKSMWRSSRISVLGSVKEGEVYHVVFRTHADFDAMSAAIISVASTKQSQGKWLVHSSTEFQGIISKLRQQSIK